MERGPGRGALGRKPQLSTSKAPCEHQEALSASKSSSLVPAEDLGERDAAGGVRCRADGRAGEPLLEDVLAVRRRPHQRFLDLANDIDRRKTRARQVLAR